MNNHQPTVHPQIGDRVQYGPNQFGTVVEVYSPTDVLVRTDAEQALVRYPTYQLTRVQGAPLPIEKKRHTARNIVLAIVGVVVFLLIAAAVQGAPSTDTAAPVAKTAPEKRTAPAPDAPTVSELEESSGVDCDSGWVEQTTSGAEMGVCADADGTMYAVVDVSSTGYPASTLAGIYKDQGNFAGSYALVGDTWLMILPTRSLAKEIKASTGGIIEQL